MIQPPISVKQGITLIVTSMFIYIVYTWLNIENWQSIKNLTFYVWVAYFALNLLLAFLLIKMWHGRNWAKWLLFIWFSIWVGFLLISLLIFGFEFSTETLFEIGTMLIEAIGWYKLFSIEASSWFKSNTIATLTHHSSGTPNGAP